MLSQNPESASKNCPKSNFSFLHSQTPGKATRGSAPGGKRRHSLPGGVLPGEDNFQGSPYKAQHPISQHLKIPRRHGQRPRKEAVLPHKSPRPADPRDKTRGAVTFWRGVEEERPAASLHGPMTQGSPAAAVSHHPTAPPGRVLQRQPWGWGLKQRALATSCCWTSHGNFI